METFPVLVKVLLSILGTINYAVFADHSCVIDLTPRNENNPSALELQVSNCFDGPPTLEDFNELLRNITGNIVKISITNAVLANYSSLLWICDLQNVEFIDVSYNRLAKVPECFASLTSLTELYLNANYLETFNENILKLGNLTIVVLDHNRIPSFRLSGWQHVDKGKIELLKLGHNHVTSIPKEVQDMQFRNLGHLDLSGNNLACSCNDKWLKTWLTKISDILVNANEIMCLNTATKTAKPLLQTPDKEFSCNEIYHSKYDNTITGLLIALFVVMLVLPAILGGTLYGIYRNRFGIFRRWKWHPFDEDNCDKESMQYDVFAACSPHDEEWNESRLLPFLIDHDFKVLSQKDLINTSNSTDLQKLTETSVKESKRTICLLSSHSIDNPLCLQALETSLARDISKKSRRTILILLGGISVCDFMIKVSRFPRDITCLSVGTRDFYEDLLYWLPTQTIDGKTRAYDVAVPDDIPLEEV